MATNSAIITGPGLWTKTGSILTPAVANDSVYIGDGTPNRATTDKSLYVTSQFEVDGVSYFDGAAYTLSALYATEDIAFSDSAGRSAFRATTYQVALGLGTLQGNQLVITEFASRALDHGHSTPTDPTVFIHSNTSPSSDNTQWLGLYHDQTDGRIQTGKGNLSIGSLTTNHSLTADGDLYVSSSLEVTGISYFDSEIELNQISAPGTSTDKLYNIGGTLYWAGSPVGGGGVTSFLGLTDTPSSYTNPSVLYTTDGTPAPSTVVETTVALGYTGNTLTLAQGTTLLTVSADCTLDQDLQVSASPEFASLSIGTEAASRFSFGAGDLYVADQLEVDGIAYFDGAVYQYNSLILGDGVAMYFNTTAVGGRMKSSNTINQMYFLLGPPEGRHLVFGDVANGDGKDYDHATQTDPTIFIHSVTDPDSDNTQWLGLYHDQTDGRIQTGKGNLSIGPTSTTSHSLATDGDLFVSGRIEVDGISYFDSECQLAQISSPGTTTDKLYNVSGTLYWSGSPISAGGSSWSAASNTDVDQVIEDVDTFDPGDNGGCVWFFNIIDNDDDTNHRAGMIVCSWDYSAGTTPVYNEVTTLDAGTVDVTLSVDMSGASGDVRLRAISTSDNWSVSVIRSSVI